MQRSQVFLILLLFSALLLNGCGGSSNGSQKTTIDLQEVFPPELPIVGNELWRFDVNHDGKNEWLVLYHIDLMLFNVDGSPTIAAIYRPVGDRDGRMPPSIVPALLWVPSQGYICLGKCLPSMMEAISDSAGSELVFTDKRCVDGACEGTVGAAFFRWQEGLDLTIKDTMPDRCMVSGDFRATLACGGFVPLGHFRGDSVTVELDQVTVTYRHNDRSDLASKETYNPEQGRYYKQAVRDVDDYPSTLLSPVEAEVVFASDPPENPIEAKLPEKLVLSFYNNYDNEVEVQKYFTPEAWVRFGQDCANGICGCTFKRGDVSRAMVKQIGYESDFKPFVSVVTQVICVDSRGVRDQRNTVTWTAQRQTDGSWRLHNVVPGGDEYLCPLTGCTPARGGG